MRCPCCAKRSADAHATFINIPSAWLFRKYDWFGTVGKIHVLRNTSCAVERPPEVPQARAQLPSLCLSNCVCETVSDLKKSVLAVLAVLAVLVSEMVLAVGPEARDPSNGTPGPGNAAAADATDVGAKDHGAKDAPVWRDP